MEWEFQNVREAYRQNLVQMFVWLTPNEENIEFIKREYLRISADKSRKAMMVGNDFDQISLFVDNLANDPSFEEQS